MPAQREFDFDIIRSLPADKKRQALRSLVSVANKRLTRLENAGINIGIIDRISNELAAEGRTRFSAAYPNMDRELALLENFLTAKSSTLRGFREARKASLETIRNRLNVKIIDERALIQFLNSNVFKELRKQVDSNQLIEDVDTLIEIGGNINDIIAQFEKYMNTELYYNQVIDRQLEHLEDLMT